MPTSAFELKQTTSSSIPFSAVQEHQINGLLAAKKGQILYKAPDDSIGMKPFDFFYLNKSQAWIVIKFPTAWEIIDVETFILEKERSKRQSLTAGRAHEISTITVKRG